VYKIRNLIRWLSHQCVARARHKVSTTHSTGNSRGGVVTGRWTSVGLLTRKEVAEKRGQHMGPFMSAVMAAKLRGGN